MSVQISSRDLQSLETLHSKRSARVKLAEKIYESLAVKYHQLVSNCLVSGIEYLLETVDPANPLRGVVLEADLRRKWSRPCNPKAGLKWRIGTESYFVTGVDLSSRSLSGNGPSSSERTSKNVDLEARISITTPTIGKSQAEISLHAGSALLGQRKIAARGRHFWYEHQKREYDHSGFGCHLRPLWGRDQSLRLLGQEYTVSQNSEATVLLVVYDHGQHYLFDLQGQLVLPSLPYGEICEQRALERSFSVAEQIDSLSMDQTREEVLHFLLDHFSKGTINGTWNTAFVQGTFSRLITSAGKLPFKYYGVDGTPKNGIYVGRRYEGREVQVQIKGPSLTMFDGKELIHATMNSKAEGAPWLVAQVKLDNVEYYRVRLISAAHHSVDVCAGRSIYRFSSPLLEEMTSAPRTNLAVLCHFQPTVGATFEVLSRSGQGVINHGDAASAMKGVYDYSDERKKVDPSTLQRR